MAEHKSASEVTIVPRGEERSGFARWVEKNGLIALAGLVLIAAVIVVQTQMSASAQADEKEQWATLTNALGGNSGVPGSLQTASPADIAAAAGQLEGSIAGPWALYALANAEARDGNYREADAALARLQKEYEGHDLNTRRFAFGDGEQRTLPEQMRRICRDQAAWREAHAGVFDNPEPPADAPKVRFETTAGDIVVALYPQRSPEHVSNLLKLAETDFYVGTKFHRIMPDFMIQGGDPNSRDNEDQSTWGQGDAGYTIDHEASELKHFRGYLSAAKKGNGIEESGAQFFITTGEPHHLNGKHTVYGKVISGMDVVDRICEAETEVANPTMPKEPVSISKVSVE